jgi:hypothetical protein
VVEGNKVVNLVLGNPTGGAVLGLGARARLLIRENESLIQFSSPTYVVRETGASALITVTRGANLASTVTVGYVSADGSATAGSDYTATPGTLTFAPGQLRRMIAVPILPDTSDENDETVTLTLTDPGAGVVLGARATATLTIRDNDTAGAVLFGTTAYFVRRTAAAAVITVVRAGAVSTDISVDYATADGTAVAGTDYTATSGTLSFGAREMVKTFSVPLVPGAPGGVVKTVTLTLSNPTGGATLGRVATALLTIRN